MKKILAMIVIASTAVTAAIPSYKAYAQKGTTLVNLVENGDFENGMPADFTTAEERRGNVSRMATDDGFVGVYT